MLNFGNKEFRNIVEQVAKNQCDIQDIKQSAQVLGEFGIKVIGYVEREEHLPDAAYFEGEYGDAYAVGTQPPYDYYVWTRPTVDIPSAHWFYIGVFPQPGPAGATGSVGPQGLQGLPGLGLISSSTNPTVITGYAVGQLWINTSTADVFKLYAGSPNYWRIEGNWKGIQGPQGPQGIPGVGVPGPIGPIGPEGPAGRSLTISGQVRTIDALPNPTLMKPGTGYLVGIQAPYELYIIVGETQNTQQWLEVGNFNDFTYVEINLPVNANQGTLSQEQYDELISSPYNTIKCNNEYYRLNDDMTSNGYLVYSHTGKHTDKIYVKTFTITISTKGFVIDVLEVADAAIETTLTLSSNGWSAEENAPFTVVQRVPIDIVSFGNANVEMLIKGINTDGIILASIEYSDSLGVELATFYAITAPTANVEVLLVSVGGER